MDNQIIVENKYISAQMSPLASLCLIGFWPDTQPAFESHIKATLGLKLPDDGLMASTWSDGACFRVHPFKMLISGHTDSTVFNVLGKQYSPTLGSLSDQSHSRVRLSLQGCKSVTLLRSGLLVDPEYDLATIGKFAQTKLGDANILVHRNGEYSFELLLPTSFSIAVGDWVRRTAENITM